MPSALEEISIGPTVVYFVDERLQPLRRSPAHGARYRDRRVEPSKGIE
jgi:hypothetical protein